MKKLLLLRHAHATGDHAMNDFDRPLSPAGVIKATTLGKLMKTKDYQPDFIYCSPALRTHQTLENLFKFLRPCTTQSPRSLYNAGRNDLRAILDQTPSSAKTVMIVAHNPGIHSLAAMLAQEEPSQHYADLMSGYAPATLSVLECNIQNWAHLMPGENALKDLMKPT